LVTSQGAQQAPPRAMSTHGRNLDAFSVILDLCLSDTSQTTKNVNVDAHDSSWVLAGLWMIVSWSGRATEMKAQSGDRALKPQSRRSKYAGVASRKDFVFVPFQRVESCQRKRKRWTATGFGTIPGDDRSAFASGGLARGNQVMDSPPSTSALTAHHPLS